MAFVTIAEVTSTSSGFYLAASFGLYKAHWKFTSINYYHLCIDQMIHYALLRYFYNYLLFLTSNILRERKILFVSV